MVELSAVARRIMDEENQRKLESLAEWQRTRPLTKAEQDELSALMAEAQKTMLTKAEAYRLLAMRGHTVYPHAEN